MDYYELFDIARTATADEVRDAYVRLVKRVHPDSGGSAALFRQVEEAYRVLSDPAARQRYDRERAVRGQTRAPHNPMPTAQDIAEAVLKGGTKWVEDVAGKRAGRRNEELRRLQAIWPKTLGLDFLRVDLKSWLPTLMSAVPGETRCTASWARKEVVEAPMSLVALRVDPGSPPRRLIWRIERTEQEWVSWRAASADGSEVQLRMHLEASPGCRPRWGRRRLPPGTHLIVDNWIA